jgi:hypothetical protein
MRTAILLAALTLASAAYAQKELDPVEAAKIDREQNEANEKVNAAHGNKKESEMSAEERRQVAEEQKEAGLGVLEKHGVSDKDYARYVAKESRDDREQQKTAAKALQKQAEDAKKKPVADPNAAKAADEVQVSRGGESGGGVEVPVQGHEGDVVIDRGNQGDDSAQVPVESGPAKSSSKRSSSSKRHHRR